MAEYAAVVIVSALRFVVPLSSQAATVTYNADDRPNLFENIDLFGTLYDVEVQWGTS